MLVVKNFDLSHTPDHASLRADMTVSDAQSGQLSRILSCLPRRAGRFNGDGGYGSRGCAGGADESTRETKGPV